MKNIIFIAITLLFFSCDTQKSNCEHKVCTAMFASITVKYIDANGNPLVVKDFEVLNLRTNKNLYAITADTVNFKGYYTVASDADLNSLSSEGDRINVKATNPKTGNVKQTELVIAGGNCACHVSKVSGVQEIVF